MKKIALQAFIAFLLLFCVPVYIGYAYFDFGKHKWHQKITVEVNTPNGVVTGSSVTRVTYTKGAKILPSVGFGSRGLRGEAVVVNLGNKKHLILILNGFSRLAFLHLITTLERERWANKQSTSGLEWKVRKKIENEEFVIGDLYNQKTGYASPILSSNTNREIGYHRFPVFLLLDLSTEIPKVDLISPGLISQSFAENYSISRITAEIVKDPVSWGEISKLMSFKRTNSGWSKAYSRDGKHELIFERKPNFRRSLSKKLFTRGMNFGFRALSKKVDHK